MTLESPQFSAIQGVDIQGGILRASGDVPVSYEVNAKYGVSMVRLHPFHPINFDLLAPLSDAPLLVRTHEV